MGDTNDEMFKSMEFMYPTTAKTLGDLLNKHWTTVGLQHQGSLQYQWYKDQGAVGSTWGDLANNFWSRLDLRVWNLLMENGDNVLLENGFFLLVEAG